MRTTTTLLLALMLAGCYSATDPSGVDEACGVTIELVSPLSPLEVSSDLLGSQSVFAIVEPMNANVWIEFDGETVSWLEFDDGRHVGAIDRGDWFPLPGDSVTFDVVADAGCLSREPLEVYAPDAS